LLADLASASPDPAEAAEIADTAARVRGAIAALADGQQDAVRLFYLQGLSHREVAEELGISAGAVKARLHQARAALAPKLVQFKTTPEAHAVTATEAVKWRRGVVPPGGYRGHRGRGAATHARGYPAARPAIRPATRRQRGIRRPLS
jgi:predicted DNA-binding protein (UPF0251 family)